MKSSNPKLVIPAVAAGVIAALAVGFFLGRQRSAPAAEPDGGKAAPQSAAPQPASTPNVSPAPTPKEMRAAELAKEKDVPAVLKDPAGDYDLVAVIEGVEANRKLTQDLQVVGAQRQRLLALSQEFDRLPADAAQQRELIAGEINEARQTLARNLQFMAQNYSYSLQFNYRLVPHVATLLLVTEGEDGTPGAEFVHRFEDAASYERFQTRRDEYLLLSVTEAKTAAEEAAGADTPADPDAGDAEPGTTAPEPAEPAQPAEPPAETPAPEPSPKLKAMQQGLLENFNYDPAKNYQVNLEKTALYARPGGSP